MRKLVLLCFLCQAAVGQKLTVSGIVWNPGNFGGLKPAEAGLDYASSFVESSNSHTTLTVDRLGLIGILTKFKVDVSFSGSLPAGMKLKVRRTGRGGLVSIAGLTIDLGALGWYDPAYGPAQDVYMELSTVPQPLLAFDAALIIGGIPLLAKVSDIPFQYRLEGLSVKVPVTSYSLLVTYTVHE